MGQRGSLLRDRSDHRWVRVAEATDRDARQAVEVFFAAVVPQPAAIATHQCGCAHAVGIHQSISCHIAFPSAFLDHRRDTKT